MFYAEEAGGQDCAGKSHLSAAAGELTKAYKTIKILLTRGRRLRWGRMDFMNKQQAAADGIRRRDGFASHWGYVLACIGSAVGMGNIWMFPSRVSKYGGGSFLIPYFLFVAIIGFSGVIGEMAFGRATRSGPVGAFQKALESRGGSGRAGRVLGAVPVLGSLALAIGYAVVMGWILKYTVGAFTGETLAPADVDGFSAQFGQMASSFGNNFWQVAGLVLVAVILIAGIGAGIEKVNKIMMPLFFLMFAGLAMYMAFQPGAAAGYRYMFTVDENIANPMTWVYALGQAFFSLSLAGNGTLIYGSYLKDDEDIIGSAWKVALFDTMAAMLAALVIIPAMATAGVNLFDGGPGLLFIHLPNLFKGIPGGAVLAAVFFIAVFFAGITSLINLFEAPIATLQERLGLTRAQAVLAILGIGTIISLCIQAIVGEWMDVVSIYICPLGAGMAGILFYWVFGSKFARAELQKGRKRPIGRWLEPMTKYVFCGLTAAVFVLGIVFQGIG